MIKNSGGMWKDYLARIVVASLCIVFAPVIGVLVAIMVLIDWDLDRR